MFIIKAIILGIVEGITEFLPISSTGHLIIFNHWIHFSHQFTNMFDVVIQLGAILSVVVYFWHRLWPFQAALTLEEKRGIVSIWIKTAIGVVPAIILGLLFGDIIDKHLFNPIVVSIMLVLGGIVLIYTSKKFKNPKIVTVFQISYKTAFFIGIIQCLAMIPGTSRSASTIIGAMCLGASKSVAAEFSFFLAIPTMVLASGYTLMKSSMHITLSEWIALGVGFFVSFVVALAVISLFMNYIKKKDFQAFGYYRIILGVMLLLLFSLHII